MSTLLNHEAGTKLAQPDLHNDEDSAHDTHFNVPFLHMKDRHINEEEILGSHASDQDDTLYHISQLDITQLNHRKPRPSEIGKQPFKKKVTQE